MRRQAAASTSGITVSVARMGQDPVLVDLPTDATVAEALTKADIRTASNTEYFVSGVRASGNDVLEHGDVLSLTTPKQAGN